MLFCCSHSTSDLHNFRACRCGLSSLHVSLTHLSPSHLPHTCHPHTSLAPVAIPPSHLSPSHPSLAPVTLAPVTLAPVTLTPPSHFPCTCHPHTALAPVILPSLPHTTISISPSPQPHSIMDARWPVVPPPDDQIIMKNSYFKDARKEFKSRIDKMSKLRNVCESIAASIVFN